MLIVLQFIAICLTTVALSTSLTHALELPGKLRLDRNAYVATQSIYYPGFTIGGLGEPLAMIAVLVLIVITPKNDPVFWWTVVAFGALIVMHGVYWVMTHPVNKFWLKGKDLKGLGKGFFSIGSARADDKETDDPDALWLRYRNRWEYSHVLRAVLATAAFISLLITLAARSPIRP